MPSFMSQFFGDRNLDAIDTGIGNIINSLPVVNRLTQNDNISGEFIDAFLKEAPQTEVQKLLESVSVSRDRLDRYNVYDEAYRYVPIIKRMMSVYIANILQKNPVTGKSLIIRETENITGDKKEKKDIIDKSKKLAEETVSAYNLLIKLRKKILPIMLQYGDCFAEIVDITQESSKKTDQMAVTSPFSTVLLESEISNSLNDLDQIRQRKITNGGKIVGKDLTLVENAIERVAKSLIVIDEINSNIIIDSDDQKNGSNDEEDEENAHIFDNILLKIHKPHNIVVLETSYGSQLGYLVVAKDEIPQHLNLTQSLSTLVGRITTIVDKDQMSQELFVDKLVRYIIKTVLDKSKQSGKISSATSLDQLLQGLDPSVQKYVARLFIEQGILQKGVYSNRLRIRFIPTNRMIAFSIPSSEFDPYGNSFIDALVFPCKLYIISQLSNVITKLSRAAPVRKRTCAH